MECLKELLKAGVDKESTDALGVTPLMSTIEAGNTGTIQPGHINCIKQLIDAGANVNFQNKCQETALLHAVFIGHEDIVKILLSAGADVNIFNSKLSVLELAVHKDGTELVTILIDAGADVEMRGERNSPIKIAALLEHVECLKELLAALDNKLDDEKTLARNTDSLKELTVASTDANIKQTKLEPLIHAVITRKAEPVENFLKSGANVNATDEDGNTALMISIKVSSKPIFQLLVDWGADVNAENNKGETALYFAVTQSHTEYERKQSEDQNKQKHILNEEFSLEGSSLMVYTLLREGAHLHDTTSGLNPCTVHLKSVDLTNTNLTVLKLLDAAGSKEKIKKLSSVHLLQNCVRDFIRKHIKQAHSKTNLYFTVPQLGLPKRLQSYLLFHAVEEANLVPNSEEKIFLQKSKKVILKMYNI